MTALLNRLKASFAAFLRELRYSYALVVDWRSRGNFVLAARRASRGWL